jgi:hypothetical protein
MSSTQLFNFNF